MFKQREVYFYLRSVAVFQFIDVAVSAGLVVAPEHLKAQFSGKIFTKRPDHVPVHVQYFVRFDVNHIDIRFYTVQNGDQGSI